jgi:hypothetical protein
MDLQLHGRDLGEQDHGEQDHMQPGLAQLATQQSQPTQAMHQVLTGPDMLPFQPPSMLPLLMPLIGVDLIGLDQLTLTPSFQLMLQLTPPKHVVPSTQLHFQDMSCHKHHWTWPHQLAPGKQIFKLLTVIISFLSSKV